MIEATFTISLLTLLIVAFIAFSIFQDRVNTPVTSDLVDDKARYTGETKTVGRVLKLGKPEEMKAEDLEKLENDLRLLH